MKGSPLSIELLWRGQQKGFWNLRCHPFFNLGKQFLLLLKKRHANLKCRFAVEIAGVHPHGPGGDSESLTVFAGLSGAEEKVAGIAVQAIVEEVQFIKDELGDN